MAVIIEMQFGILSWVDPGNHLLDRMHIGANWRIRLNRQSVAAMCPYDKYFGHLFLL